MTDGASAYGNVETGSTYATVANTGDYVQNEPYVDNSRYTNKEGHMDGSRYVSGSSYNGDASFSLGDNTAGSLVNDTSYAHYEQPSFRGASTGYMDNSSGSYTSWNTTWNDQYVTSSSSSLAGAMAWDGGLGDNSPATLSS